MPNLTPEQINALIAKLKKFPYAAVAGSDNLGPLDGPPTVAPEIETSDVTLYETGSDVQARYLKRNDLMVTIRTRDIAKAMALQSAFTKGENILASAKKVSLTLVPITSGSEETITFANAYLQPGLNYTPGQDEEPSVVELQYLCKADATTGKPFTYGSAAASNA